MALRPPEILQWHPAGERPHRPEISPELLQARRKMRDQFLIELFIKVRNRMVTAASEVTFCCHEFRQAHFSELGSDFRAEITEDEIANIFELLKQDPSYEPGWEDILFDTYELLAEALTTEKINRRLIKVATLKALAHRTGRYQK